MNIECDSGIAHDLSDFFTFRVPGYKFMPAYRSRAWDGKIRLFNAFGGELYVGLLQYVVEFAERKELTIQSLPWKSTTTIEETKEFFNDLDPFEYVLKDREVKDYVRVDPAVMEAENVVTLQEETVKYLEEVCKMFEKRGFAIKNAIDFMKFTQGEF